MTRIPLKFPAALFTLILFSGGALHAFADHQDATYVLGQNDFTSVTSGKTQNTMKFPANLAYDSDNARLFVGDVTNNRVLVFNVAPGSVANRMNASNVLGQTDFTSGRKNMDGSSISNQSGLFSPGG